MKKLISLFISLGLLALIYWKIDFGRLLPVFASSDPLWMTLSLAMVIPLTLFTSWRLQQLMPERGQLGFGEANRLILVASVLNLVLPSKMGDIAKAWFMKDRGHLPGSLALSLVVFEKSCDMLSLLVWCVFGMIWLAVMQAGGAAGYDVFRGAERLGTDARFGEWLASNAGIVWGIAFAGVLGLLVLGVLLLASRRFAGMFFGMGEKFAPGKMKAKFAKLGTSWNEMHGYFWASKRRLIVVSGTSIFIWFLHLLQIWMFILALKASAPFFANLALSALAILAGLLPLTFAGVGTRDGALVLFYAPYFDTPVAAALGLLCTARYILPAIGGLQFAPSYFQRVKTMKRGDLATENTAA